MTFTQEKLKVEERLPAARAFIREHKLNETIAGELDDIGIIVMGGLTNSVLRALERMGLADVFGASRVPMLVLNVVYPLVPEEIREFCAGKRAVLVVEEGHPDYIEQAVNVELRRADIQTHVLGKGPLPQAGEYTSDVLLEGLAAFLQDARPNGLDADSVAEKARGLIAHKAESRRRARAVAAAPAGLLHRLPGAPGVLRHQADAARTGADPYQHRHRLPFVRDLRAVLARQFDPRLRHVAGQRRGGRRPTWRSARSPSWATAASGITG